MKNPKYRDALTDIYHLVEEFEQPPINWVEFAQRMVDLNNKYQDPVVQEWLMGICAGVEKIKRTEDDLEQERRMANG